MGIQKDAEELLIYFYKEYTKENDSRIPSFEYILKKTNWTSERINRAIDYLNGKRFIDVKYMLGGEILILGLTSDGIDAIENQEKFQYHFNHKINLGIYEFSWGASEK